MKSVLIIFTLLSSTLLHAALTDDASNYSAWTDGSNQGAGFGAWSLTDNNNGSSAFAGYFLGDSTAGAGNINTSGKSFVLYANPNTAFATATRTFSNNFSTGQTLSFQMALNFDNGNKGFKLRSGLNDIFSFDVGSGGSVSSSATLNPGSGAGYDYGGSDAVLNLSLTMDSSSQLSYQVSRSSSQGFQGDLFTGTVTGIGSNIDNFQFYIANTDDGQDANNLYFNNLGVVPEPTAVALFGLGAVISVMLRRARKQESLLDS